MIEMFKALSEENRLRILALLLEEEMCVCEIEASFRMTQSNASRHLTALRKSGILESYKNAQWAYYRINETFKIEHKELWDYLQIKLKEIPTYKSDYKAYKIVKAQNLC